MTNEDIKAIEDTIEDFKSNYKDGKELCCEPELIIILEKLYKSYKKYKNISKSEKAIHTNLKRQRNELEKIRVGLVADKMELELKLAKHSKGALSFKTTRRWRVK